MIGRYIDALADANEWEALDRVIVAQNWTAHPFAFVDNDGCRCLEGHVRNWGRGVGSREDIGVDQRLFYRLTHSRLGNMHYVPSSLYPALVRRFGLDRVVRAIKTRAGRHTKPSIPEQQHAISDVTV